MRLIASITAFVITMPSRINARVMIVVVILAIIALAWMSWTFAGRVNPILRTDINPIPTQESLGDTQEDIIENLRNKATQ